MCKFLFMLSIVIILINVCIETKYIHCEAHLVYKYLQQKRERWIYYEYNCEPNIVIDLDLNNRVACV